MCNLPIAAEDLPTVSALNPVRWVNATVRLFSDLLSGLLLCLADTFIFCDFLPTQTAASTVSGVIPFPTTIPDAPGM